MTAIKVLIKENRGTLQESSEIDKEGLRELMDLVLAGDVDPKLLINIETGEFALSRPDMTGRNFTFDANGNINIAANLDRDYINFNADLDVGDFENPKKNPAMAGWLKQGGGVMEWLEKGKKISDIAAKELDTAHGKLSGKEYREAIGDFRSLGRRIVDRIRDTIVKGWRKIKVLFPRNWTSLKNRLYLKTLKYSPPKPKGIAHIGELPKPLDQQKPHLSPLDKAAQRDLEKARRVQTNSQKKIDNLEGRRVKREMKGKPRSARLEAQIKKFKERKAAAATLEDAIKRAMKAADAGDVAKGVAKKSGKFATKFLGPLGWLVTGFVATSLFDDCRALGATKSEASTIAALDETLGGAFLVDPLKDWLSQRKKDAFLRRELARGKVGTMTEVGPYTKEDDAVVKRVSAHQAKKRKHRPRGVRPHTPDLTHDVYKKHRMAYPLKMRYNVWEENLKRTGSTKTKVLKESNKIKIKINS